MKMLLVVVLALASLMALACLSALVAQADEASPTPMAMPMAQPFPLPELPYAQNALEPYISERTMSFHYGKHQKTYVDTLNKLVAGTHWQGQSLEQIIRKTAGKPADMAIFNSASQVWNHTFFWHSMAPGGGGAPTGNMLTAIEQSFGSYDNFKAKFMAAAAARFGSGWVWLEQDKKGLRIVSTANADSPLAHGRTALLVCDVWEHAYYLDYQNRRADFVMAFLDHLANWQYAETQLKR